MTQEQKDLITNAYNSGRGDESVSQMLCDQAQEYFNNEIKKPVDMTEDEYDELCDAVTEAYIEGFYGTESLETILEVSGINK